MALFYKFTKYLQNLKYNAKKRAFIFFIWFCLVYYLCWCSFRTVGWGCYLMEKILYMTKVMCQQSLIHRNSGEKKLSSQEILQDFVTPLGNHPSQTGWKTKQPRPPCAAWSWKFHMIFSWTTLEISLLF